MKWIRHPASDFSELESAWRSVNARGSDSPLLDPAFIGPLLRNFGTGREILLSAQEGSSADAPTPVALGVFAQRRPGVWSAFSVPNGPLSAWVQVPGLDRDCALAGLARVVPGPCLLVELSQQDPMHEPRPQECRAVRTSDFMTTAYVRMGGDFSEYWQRRGKNLRRNLKRQRNRLDREGISTRFELLSESEAMSPAVADHGILESGGWKGEVGTALQGGDSQGRFYREVLERFADQGEALVGRYWYGESLVASDLCLYRDSTLYVLKTAYDSSRKTTSPSNLLREELFRQVVDRRAGLSRRRVLRSTHGLADEVDRGRAHALPPQLVSLADPRPPAIGLNRFRIVNDPETNRGSRGRFWRRTPGRRCVGC